MAGRGCIEQVVENTIEKDIPVCIWHLYKDLERHTIM